MEQILAFVLGVGAVAFVWVVVTAFKTLKKVKQIEQAITGHQFHHFNFVPTTSYALV